MLSQDFKEFVKLLNEKEVEYLRIGVNFDDCYAQRGQYEVGDIMINVIALVDLIKNKKASGRLRDLDDLENLK